MIAGLLAPSGVILVALGSPAASGQQLLVSGLGLLVVTVKFPGGIASAGPWLRSLLSPRRDRPAARRDTDDVEVFAIELDPVASGASDPSARGAGR